MPISLQVCIWARGGCCTCRKGGGQGRVAGYQTGAAVREAWPEIKMTNLHTELPRALLLGTQGDN